MGVSNGMPERVPSSIPPPPEELRIEWDRKRRRPHQAGYTASLCSSFTVGQTLYFVGYRWSMLIAMTDHRLHRLDRIIGDILVKAGINLIILSKRFRL
jgi:hypothetical protein